MPEVVEEELTAGVGDEVAVFGAHGQVEARLTRPLGQLVREQLLGGVLVGAVAHVQQLHRDTFEVPDDEAWVCCCLA